MAITLGIPGKNDATGWSVITPTSPSADTGTPAGSRLIYVSSSTGNDSNVGSLASPKQTISGGMSLIRNNKPDWLLLKKGDTWTDEGFAATGGHSGQDASNPMVFTSYPSTPGARPKLDINSSVAAYTAGTGATGGNFRVFYGIDFNCYSCDPSDGRYTNASTGFDHQPRFDYLHIEDCRFLGVGVNISTWANQHIYFPGAETRSGTLIFHRNVICHINTMGSLWDNIADGRFTDSTWYKTCEGLNSVNNHAFYSQETSLPYLIKNCFNVDTSYNSFKVRGGANVSNCFIARGGDMLDMYGFNQGVPYGYNVGLCTVADNVFQEGRWTGTVPPGISPGGTAVEIVPVADDTGQDTDILRNIFANNVLASGVSSPAINIAANSKNNRINNNRCGLWAQGKFFNQDTGTGNATTTRSGNIVDANANGTEDTSGLAMSTYGWLHPEYTLADYGTAQGIASSTFDKVMQEVILQSKDNWRVAYTAPAVNDFFRTQFGMTLLGVDGDSGGGGAAAAGFRRPRIKMR